MLLQMDLKALWLQCPLLPCSTSCEHLLASLLKGNKSAAAAIDDKGAEPALQHEGAGGAELESMAPCAHGHHGSLWQRRTAWDFNHCSPAISVPLLATA